MSLTEELLFNQFIDAINDHDCDSLIRLFHAEMQFKNNQGRLIKQSDVLFRWINSFHVFPNHKIDIQVTMVKDCCVAAFGCVTKSGHKGRDCRPVSFLARVRNGLITDLNVYGDGGTPFMMADENVPPSPTRIRGLS